MSNEIENANIELDPESVKALEALVEELDDEVEGFGFDAKNSPTLSGSMSLRIGDKPIMMPITFEPKGIISNSSKRSS